VFLGCLIVGELDAYLVGFRESVLGCIVVKSENLGAY